MSFSTIFQSCQEGNNERLCAMGPCLQLKRFPPPGIKPETARSVDQHLTHRATATPLHYHGSKAKLSAEPVNTIHAKGAMERDNQNHYQLS